MHSARVVGPGTRTLIELWALEHAVASILWNAEISETVSETRASPKHPQIGVKKYHLMTGKLTCV